MQKFTLTPQALFEEHYAARNLVFLLGATRCDKFPNSNKGEEGVDAWDGNARIGQGEYLVENVNLTNKRKLLDLGGGAGSYSMALCAANPQLKAFVVEQKEPLAIALPLVKKQNLQNQITLVEGDFNTIDIDTDYDVVLISGVVCTKSETECIHLFDRAYNALIPGGLIIVQDFMQIGRSSQQQSLDIMMDLYLKIAFDPQASDRHGDQVQSWLTAVGFIHPQQIPLPTQYALILAKKP